MNASVKYCIDGGWGDPIDPIGASDHRLDELAETLASEMGVATSVCAAQASAGMAR